MLSQDNTVSPLHARLQLQGNAWWLADCDSDNGTFLLVEDAGRRVAIGDVFRMAHCELQFFARPVGTNQVGVG